MAQGDNFKRNNLPTIQQIRYLIELKKNNSQRGCISKISEVCKVSHSSVSRYFKICIENGYLTEEYIFTNKGKIWLNGYMNLLKKLVIYLKRIGIPTNDIKDKLKNMIENIDYYTLTCIVDNDIHSKSQIDIKEDIQRNVLKDVLEYGTYDIYFTIYDIENEKGTEISVINSGFDRHAILKNNKRGSYFIFKLCEMEIKSRLDESKIKGTIDSFKYENNGFLHTIKIVENMIKIPLNHFKFFKMKSGEIRGTLKISISCSVGREHFSETTAFLVVWL